MRTPSLAALVAALALASAAPVAHAERTADASVTITTEKKAPVSDAQRYAAREARSQAAADFKGAAEGVVVIGTSTIILAALIVLIVIML